MEIEVVAAAVIEQRRLLLVSKRQAPDVFYLPGGKRDPGEDDLACLRRELTEELGVAAVARNAGDLGRARPPVLVGSYERWIWHDAYDAAPLPPERAPRSCHRRHPYLV